MSSSHRTGPNSATLTFLRERLGRKFSAEEIAAEIGFTAAEVKRALTARFHDGRYGLQRECVANKTFRYFMAEAGPAVNPQERAIARWMNTHKVAARPTEIARATRQDPEEVARILAAWSKDGSVVKCELPLRSGIDRYQYRLAHSAVQHANGSVGRPSKKRLAEAEELEAA